MKQVNSLHISLQFESFFPFFFHVPNDFVFAICWFSCFRCCSFLKGYYII